MTLGMFMRRAGLEARPHGFRSSLREWLAEGQMRRTKSQRRSCSTLPVAK